MRGMRSRFYPGTAGSLLLRCWIRPASVIGLHALLNPLLSHGYQSILRTTPLLIARRSGNLFILTIFASLVLLARRRSRRRPLLRRRCGRSGIVCDQSTFGTRHIPESGMTFAQKLVVGGYTVHLGYLFGICVEKNSELVAHLRKFKG